MRPRIAITGPDRGGYPAWFFARMAVRAAGGDAVRLTPARGHPNAPLDGLVLGGGADVEPERYRRGPHPHDTAPPMREHMDGRERARTLGGYLLAPLVYVLRRLFSAKSGPRVDPERDALETALLHRALDEGLPVLGICRGAQLLNVTLGGTLHHDVASYYVEQPRPWTVFPRKRVRVEPDSHLAGVLGATDVWVNSLHRQAVDDLGRGLAITAREDNGVVQAIERTDRPFVIGVQWHPEYLPQRPEQRRLFAALVAAAGARKRSEPSQRSVPLSSA